MTSFLELPGELRNVIYEDVLNGVFVQGAQTPWDNLPKVGTFLSLLLCNKQVKREVQSLFDGQYATGPILHCDNVSTLESYCLKQPWCPAIRNARFSIRKICLDVVSTTERTDEMERLLSAQPGFKHHDWVRYIQLFRAEPRRQNYRLHPGPPPFVQPEWVAEEQGFRCFEDRGARGFIQGRQTFGGFKKLEYPTLQNGCKVTAYSWHTQSHGRHTTESGSMVLEGRLRDVVID